MGKKCLCNRDISADREFCVFCDPATSDTEKLNLRKQGGLTHFRIPHNLNPADYKPLTPESLRRLYEDLISASIEGHRNDLAGLIKDLSKILPKASEVVAYENMAFLNDRLSQIEAKRSSGYLKGSNDVDVIEYSQPD